MDSARRPVQGAAKRRPLFSKRHVTEVSQLIVTQKSERFRSLDSWLQLQRLRALLSPICPATKLVLSLSFSRHGSSRTQNETTHPK